MVRTIVASLSRPVDIASLVFARVAFGLLMLWEVWRYFKYDRIYRYWIEPDFHFTYPGFDWLSPLSGDGMYWLFIGLGVLSILIILGFFYRIAATLFFIAFTYTFLLEQGRYLNHFYLVCLLSFLLIFLPAHRSTSLDTWFGFTKKSDTTPAWSLWILQFQMAVVYFFGGIAKIDKDWLAGQPLRDWLGGCSNYPIIGKYMTSEPVVHSLAWGGMLFDLLIPFLLLWKRTRMVAFLAAVGFHVANMVLWNIGIFPWLAIAMTALFFDPSWPRKFFRLPLFGTSFPPSGYAKKTVVASLVAAYCFAQIVIPLRHHFIPGDVSWTEDGHRFSWRMKLRSRDGKTDFHVVEKKTGRVEKVDPRDHLERWQVGKMDTNPDMMLQFARKLEREYKQANRGEIAVHARSAVSVNGRPEQDYFPLSVDLTEVSRMTPRFTWLNEFDDAPNFGLEQSLVLD
ncbi:MAG: HTTM domain-containing protein [Verrucomicrobiales bacterium]|nr:HTTM domain-containing protein [Verrucomicrobiales bacterium]